VELLENAIRAANQNPTLGRVQVRVHKQEEEAVLEIQDNGPGIDFESQQRIFDPFYTTKRNWRSTGLGLTAVYGIVKSMNGSIVLQSSPGNGAHFSIHLPIQASHASGRADPSGSSKKSGRYYEDLR
jgi:signal transduction histidine kinase